MHLKSIYSLKHSHRMMRNISRGLMESNYFWNKATQLIQSKICWAMILIYSNLKNKLTNQILVSLEYQFNKIKQMMNISQNWWQPWTMNLKKWYAQSHIQSWKTLLSSLLVSLSSGALLIILWEHLKSAQCRHNHWTRMSSQLLLWGIRLQIFINLKLKRLWILLSDLRVNKINLKKPWK